MAEAPQRRFLIPRAFSAEVTASLASGLGPRAISWAVTTDGPAEAMLLAEYSAAEDLTNGVRAAAPTLRPIDDDTPALLIVQLAEPAPGTDGEIRHAALTAAIPALAKEIAPCVRLIGLRGIPRGRSFAATLAFLLDTPAVTGQVLKLS